MGKEPLENEPYFPDYMHEVAATRRARKEAKLTKKAAKLVEKERRRQRWRDLGGMSNAEREDLLDNDARERIDKGAKFNNKIIIPFWIAYAFLIAIWEFGFDRRKLDGSQPARGFFDERRLMYMVLNAIDALEDFWEATEVLLSKDVPEMLYGAPYPEYTVVIEPLNTLLIPEYDLTNHWQFRKVPGFDAFLQLIPIDHFKSKHNNIELCLWTSKSHVETWSFTWIFSELGVPVATRENCTYRPGIRGAFKNGHFPKPYHEKPLHNLNRDFKKLILIDTDPKAFANYPENGLIMPKNTRDINNSDTTKGLISFLLTISKVAKVPDVRPIIAHYRQYEDWLEEYSKDPDYITREADRQRQELGIQNGPPRVQVVPT